jgi:hypothetical protein
MSLGYGCIPPLIFPANVNRGITPERKSGQVQNQTWHSYYGR